MTNEEKSILIAKHLGKDPVYTCYKHSVISEERMQENKEFFNVCPWCNVVLTLEDCPDYFNDLNAAHEMEKALKWEQRKQFHSKLADISGFSYCEADTREETDLEWACHICHAEAKDRAEAFGLTLNLWMASQK